MSASVRVPKKGSGIRPNQRPNSPRTCASVSPPSCSGRSRLSRSSATLARITSGSELSFHANRSASARSCMHVPSESLRVVSSESPPCCGHTWVSQDHPRTRVRCAMWASATLAATDGVSLCDPRSRSQVRDMTLQPGLETVQTDVVASAGLRDGLESRSASRDSSRDSELAKGDRNAAHT